MVVRVSPPRPPVDRLRRVDVFVVLVRRATARDQRGARTVVRRQAAGDPAAPVQVDEERRAFRRRGVPIGPGGVVADYVPFYFAARSPMLYAISRGNVPAYQDGQDPLVYLVTDLDRLQKVGCRFVFTDRNAYYQTATYAEDPAELDQLVDWELMEATMWNNTAAEPDRMERRMAELLVHESVPFSAVLAVGVRSAAIASASAVAEVLGTLDDPPPVLVRPNWYY